MAVKLLRDTQIFVSPRLHLFVLIAMTVIILDMYMDVYSHSSVIFTICAVLYVLAFFAYTITVYLFVSMSSFYRFDLYWNIEKEEVYNAVELYEQRLTAARTPLAITVNVIAICAYVAFAILTPTNILHYANVSYISLYVYMLYVKMPELQKEQLMKQLTGAIQ